MWTYNDVNTQARAESAGGVSVPFSETVSEKVLKIDIVIYPERAKHEHTACNR